MISPVHLSLYIIHASHNAQCHVHQTMYMFRELSMYMYKIVHRITIESNKKVSSCSLLMFSEMLQRHKTQVKITGLCSPLDNLVVKYHLQELQIHKENTWHGVTNSTNLYNQSVPLEDDPIHPSVHFKLLGEGRGGHTVLQHPLQVAQSHAYNIRHTLATLESPDYILFTVPVQALPTTHSRLHSSTCRRTQLVSCLPLPHMPIIAQLWSSLRLHNNVYTYEYGLDAT